MSVMSEHAERRSEARTTIDQYYSVEFLIPDAEFIYQFRIWNLSSEGLCVVVKENSDLLKHLSVGDVLNLRYHPVNLADPIVKLKTEIKHITKQEEGRFKGHALVGLFIQEKQTSDH